MSLSRTWLPLVAFCCALGNGAVPDAWAGGSHVRRSEIVDVVEKARGAVVNIHSERSARGPKVDDLNTASQSPSRSNGMGTGIIIDPRGYMVTNHHVVEDVSVIRVRLSDGGTYVARVLARDKENDLALLKIDVGRPLPTIPVGTSSDLMVGETVVAIGNAYGYEHTVTVGVVSALNRDVTLNKDISYKALIQTDASINPGNSGGPLLNVKGELVGVNVAIRAGAQGIGFVIPVDQMVQVVSDLLAKRRSNDVVIGITCKNCVHPDESPCRTLEVEKVEFGSPAAKAGLKAGDVLLRAGDVTLASTIDLERAMIDLQPGGQLPIVVRRGEQERQLAIGFKGTIRTTAANTPADLAWRQLGLRMSPTAGDFTRNGSKITTGMLVLEINPGSPAARAGFKTGDVLIGLHEWQTENIDNVAYILNHPKAAEFYPLRFYLVRQGEYRQGWLQTPE